MKEFLTKIRKVYSRLNKTILFFSLELIFLILIDLFNKYTVIRSIKIFDLVSKTSVLFSFAWIVIICILLFVSKPVLRRIETLILNSVLIILTSASFLMYSYFHSVFSFKDLLLAGDGLSFISSIFKFISLKFVIVILMFIILTILLCIIKTDKIYKLKSIHTFIIIILLVLSLFSINFARKSLTDVTDGWDSTIVINNNSNYYNSWIEPTKLMQICGPYEYYIKDFYKSFLEKENINDAITSAEKFIRDHKKADNQKSDYYGIFKNKNLIFVMMESEDDWMINEKVTPTIYEMMQHGFNFTNHYSPSYVTGDTANTEFIANTGLYPSINRLSPNYAYVDNAYPYSIANLFKKNGYVVNSFHCSNGFIYNRSKMHLSLGYEKYYNYSEMRIPEDRFALDSEIIKNGYDLITGNDKFMSFIITYSPHDPYNYEKIECKENIEDIKKLYPEETNEELLCSYSASRETDNMFKLLLEKLEKDNKLDNTVIVAFSDHPNKDISPNNEDYKVNKTAFFIYNHSMGSNQVETLTSSINILPTVINLFGIETEYIYPGYDALNYEDGYVIFKDYTHFNGKEVLPITKDMKSELDYSNNLLVSNYYKE